MNYILIVDDEADIRDIYEMVLKRAFPLDVELAESGNKALAIIKNRGNPDIIITDYRMPDGDGLYLYQTLKAKKSDIPFIVSSAYSKTNLISKFPDILGFIEKPNIIGPVVELVDKVVSKLKVPPMYVPIRISLLLRLGTANFDLFMKLSESKFIKVLNAGEAFIPTDEERFSTKGLQYLYITATDTELYLKSFEKNFALMTDSEKNLTDNLPLISLETFESVERIAAAMGWTPEVLVAAKHAVNLAVKAVTLEPNILKLFKQKLSDPASKYSGHVTMVALLSCGFCHKLGWISESTQMKLGLAALLHDLTVDEKVYDDIFQWNQSASNFQIKTPEVIKYRNHPIDAANLLLSMKNVPSDVDQIILQHHEMKDGTGFPRGLIASRISPMACIFIIVEDLINFLEGSEDFDEKIQLYVKDRETRYHSGNFKKIFDVFKESVEKSRHLN